MSFILKIKLTLLLCSIVITSNGQIITGVYDKNQIDNLRKIKEEIPITKIVLPAINNQILLARDANEKSFTYPIRFGEKIPINLDLKKAGYKVEKEGMSSYSISVKSEEAYSLNFVFSTFKLIDGAELLIYSAEKEMVIGPLTSNDDIKKVFRTDLIKGNEVIFELYEPTNTKESSQILLSHVIHGYRNLFEPRNFGDSDSNCQIDVKCPQGSNWVYESNGVAMIIMDDIRICTGAILNNVCQNLSPNFLTAFHCIDLNEDGVISVDEKSIAENWIFRFQYKSPSCNGSEPNSWITFHNGSIFRSAWRNSDFALVEMQDRPQEKTGIRYLGWSKSNNTPNSTVGIHHPQGDVMKIAIDNHSPTVTTPTYFGYTVGSNHFWNVSWNQGITASGSSGSPLFDHNKKVIGQLAGGGSFCNTPQSPDQYGRFDLSWGRNDNGAFLHGRNAQNSLAPWLDPNNTGAVTTNTILLPSLSGPSCVYTSNSTFSLSNVPAGASVSWDESSNLTKVSSNNSSITVKAPSSNTSGSGWVKAIITTDCGSFDVQKNFWVGLPEAVL